MGADKGQKSSSSSSGALDSLSASLLTARRNADNLLITAQQSGPVLRIKSGLSSWEGSVRKELGETKQKFQSFRGLSERRGATDDGQLLPRLPGAAAGLRRVRSSVDVRRPQPKSRELAKSSTHRNLEEQARDWDLLQALNQTIEKAATSSRPLFPSVAPSLGQGRTLVHPDAAKSLEHVASQLMQGPKAAVRGCQQTFENAQHNYKLLGEYIQGRVPANQTMQRLLGSGAPSAVASGSKFTTNSALRAPSRSSSAQEVASLEGTPTDEQQSAQQAVAAIQEAVGALNFEDAAKQLTPQQQQARRRRAKEGSSLREPGRNVAIVTTASLPWMTGTAVNPLLRAAYLARDEEKRGESASQINLVIPWLAPADQAKVFPHNLTFKTPAEQEAYVRDWATKRTGLPCNFKVTFYPGRYAIEKGSILPVGDPTQYIPNNEADVAVLEEPEHLTWYHHGRRWTDKFNHVVGIMHTNYLDYARREEGGEAKAKFLEAYNNWVCRVHCHKVVKLSDAVQPLPRQTTQFVHGVPKSFLAVGEKKAQPPAPGEPRFSRGAYFMGKVVWAKGYTELVDLLKQHREREGEQLHIDCYGNGEDLQDVARVSRQEKLEVDMKGAIDHLDPSMHEYKVFINPSRSDVVATVTAEALAMGKWVIVEEHPSNKFFSTFSNCLVYKTPEQFSQHLKHALHHDPKPMPEVERTRLTWEDATQRFLDVSELGPKDMANPVERGFDRAAWMLHNSLCGVEPLRVAAGAGTNTRDNPEDLATFQPSVDAGGLFDRKQRSQAIASK